MVPDAVRSLLLMFCLSVLVTGCASKPEPVPVVDNSAEAGELARQAWQAQQQGNTEEALARYRQAFSLDPRNAMTANNLALLLREQGRFGEAASMLRKGLEHSPDTEELHYNLAIISELYLLDLDTALRHYRRYSELADAEGKQVAGWIADLERRVE
ncbi:tetratricopeptide repeat protein [Marinobacter panjinensis]|uniref:Tetratricopeptide repeat protein n=1 Tax=Marinobacter panjinensis TaxID=2576384 RepID=A0A4U6R135_9GAMM|nr:tetratricopeptide repeat protein [Marinobacter panjinensis]MCR8915857.1 tetratricopeptide repeat protein [Marinobacter panjinensis]TKV67170.1 tetratricopeptide repeat protein [Marinobacter panjinensis]